MLKTDKFCFCLPVFIVMRNISVKSIGQAGGGKIALQNLRRRLVKMLRRRIKHESSSLVLVGNNVLHIVGYPYVLYITNTIISHC